MGSQQLDIGDDAEQLRTTTSFNPINEQGAQHDDHQPKATPNAPSTPRPNTHNASQHSSTPPTPPTPSANPSSSSPPTPSPPSPAPKTPSSPPSSPIAVPRRPPPSSRHYYLKEMWPGQPICHLCTKQYKTTNRAIRALPCGDIFHRGCVDRLLGRGREGRCPSCEGVIPEGWFWRVDKDVMMQQESGSAGLCGSTSGAGEAIMKKTEMRDGDGGSRAGVERKGRVFGKWCRGVEKVVGPCGLGRKPKRLYSSYKTESGQSRYVEREVGVVMPGARIGHVRGEADCWGSC